jgi:hypothetical protein
MGRKFPFQRKHEGEYGTNIASRNTAGQVDCIQCQFFTSIGRESPECPGVKRKRTENNSFSVSHSEQSCFAGTLNSSVPMIGSSTKL